MNQHSTLILTPAPPSPRRNPWTRLGRSFAPTSDPQLALTASGLDWTVSKVGLRTEDLAPVPGHCAVRRDDTGAVLGIVGQDYQVLQNREAFSFFADLAAETHCSFETAGCLRGGKVAWVLAHLPDLGIRIGDDESKTYLLISTGHGGNKPLTVAPTSIRVACANTLNLAEAQSRIRRARLGSGVEAGYVVRHLPGMAAAVGDIRQAYRQTIAAHKATMAFYAALAGRPMTEAMVQAFFRRVFEVEGGRDESGRARAMRQAREERLGAILAGPTSNVRGTAGSAFALFQAAVEYVDHDRRTRTDEEAGEDEQRLASAVWGSGAALKRRAVAAIVEVAGV